MYQAYYEWDFQTAEKSYQRAIEINPSLADAQYHLAWLYELLERDEEAIRLGELTMELDPLSALYSAWLAEQYRDAGMYDKAIETAEATLKDAADVADDDMIFDIGPKSAQELADIIAKAGTIVWNGPVGVFEFDQFGEGTKTVSMAIANAKGFSLAGGGDTIAAIQKYDIYDRVSYISTAGGAFLEYLEGKVLPAVAMLEERAKD